MIQSVKTKRWQAQAGLTFSFCDPAGTLPDVTR
jgi:hypothetical protein